METSRFSFELPDELIARHPPPRRTDARLMVLERTGRSVDVAPAEAVAHRRITDLPELITPGTVVVLNDTRVVRARLTGRDERGQAVSLLLLEPQDGQWTAMARGARRLARGGTLRFPEQVTATTGPVRRAQGASEAGAEQIAVRFAPAIDVGYLERHGEVPLPPYLGRTPDPADAERYQTVYARTPGAAAAPTAGLHFTPALLDQLRAAGATVVTLTLHVGAGTFAPLRSERVEEHRMHAERYLIPDVAATAIESARAAGRPVLAVGTTVVRSLESAWDGRRLRRGAATTDLFIYPGYQFRVVDQLLTNFHTPRSSLLVMVSAFAGEARIRAAYAAAITGRYRFFSYGDAMLIR